MSRIDLFEAIQTFDQEQAKQLFHTYIDEITTIFDKENATLLHVAANYSNREIVEYYLTQYDLKIQENALLYNMQQKKIWLNKKDNEGFTCIHYAVFRGNQKLAFFLEQHGADIYSINKQGLTVMHIAAQGDSPVLMYYYLSKGMKISAEDSKGSTALHWACYSGQQNAANALLSWGAEMDRQDFTYGMTPLHLAVMSGNGRIVKKLLIRGCDRSIKNYGNKLPIEIARQNEYKNITQMIEDKQGVQQLFNIKTPYRKIDKKTFPFYFFLILFLTNYILNISFVIFKHFPEQCELAFAYLILGLLVASLFFSISVRKPGFIEAERDINQFEMLKRNLPSKICFDCMLLKPERSKHCDICKKCVMVYDHHCPWVANCIGAKNYLLFYTFLIFVWIFMIFTIVFQILNLIAIDWSNDSALQIVRMVCIFYGLLCSGLFIIPLTYLLFVQTNNCFTNKTTFQRYSYQAKNQNSEENSKTQSFTTSIESLQQKLIIKKPSQNLTPQQHQRQISQKTMVKVKGLNSNYTQNCYNMCWGNANNIIYQYGKLS